MSGYLHWDAWVGVMTLAVFTVCERLRLATGSVSMVGRWYLVRRAMGSSRLRCIGLSGGFGMTTLGSGAGGFGMTNLGGGVGVFIYGDGEEFEGWDAVELGS